MLPNVFTIPAKTLQEGLQIRHPEFESRRRL